LARAEGLAAFLEAIPALVLGAALAGWLATGITLMAGTNRQSPPSGMPRSDHEGPGLRDDRKVPITVWCAMAVYVLVSVSMNWQLYRGLLVPHGDSAMYEEHLWNLLHGKGFRSYLDQGLFLGEHIQFVHLFLIPLYVLWPSHLLLELCESTALAIGAVPVFWIARRHTGSTTAAIALACAYLLYFPMQFLDIAIDLKTFRPISFGIPALLLALDELERRHYGRMLVWMAVTLSAKEDFALILAPLGVWIALARPGDAGRTPTRLGWTLAGFSVVYLILVVTVILPWFRGGAEPHYAHYFGNLGGTPSDIVRHVLTDPVPVVAKLVSLRSWLYLLMLLVPLG
ncbi:MAG TPA: DUF2079 domain-containing protein, partial [Planctomycetaceae bacterium]|nr:DUF2079 domain-containing protein [Planctomycetaceae bacterium]